MAGGFVFVVGPSGAGKDSLIGAAKTALQGDPRFIFPRRVVTRPSSSAEEHDTLDEATFAKLEADGRFTLAWRAHGLCYAVPGSALDAVLGGAIAVCNISRRVVPWARLHLPRVTVVEVTAPMEVLHARLVARGRADDGDLTSRLVRSRQVWTEVDHSIVNDGPIETAADDLVRCIRAHGGDATAPLQEHRVKQRLVFRFL